MSKDKIRLYQLARELNVESKDLVDQLQAMGADVKNHMTAIDSETRKLAEDLVAGKVKPPSGKGNPPPAAAGPAAPPPPPTRPSPVPPPKGAKPAEIPDPRRKRPGVIPVRATEIVEEESAVEASEEKVTTLPEVEPPADEPVEETFEQPVETPIAATAPPEKEPTEVAPAEVKSIPRQREIKPIPAPNRSRIVSLDTPSGGAGTGQSPSRPSPRDRRPAQRSIVSGPPQGSEPSKREPAKAPEVKTQKPVVKFADHMKAGKFPAPTATPDLLRGAPDIDGDEPKRKGVRGGGPPAPGVGGQNLGREDRQRRRGQRAAERRLTVNASGDDEDELRRRRSRAHKGRREIKSTKPTGPIAITMPTTVRAFSEATGIKAGELQFKLMELTGTQPTINSSLTEEEAGMLALAYELEIEIRREKGAEELIEEALLAQKDAEEDLVVRPPVVTFMGHVDHGKTSLMDRIRKANVAAGEAGGITQHIGAYQVTSDDGLKVTFLDTPGHEAFTAMRARGANVTDVVVLVVAANDGVMPQTEEAINHAKAAEVPIVVAVNKSDLPGANFDRILQQLSSHGLVPDTWGGDTIIVKTSATTGMGMDELLEAIHTVAELGEHKANPNRGALGNCIEASMDADKGVQATMLVLNGTLKTGDVIVCGASYGRVRSMYNDQGIAIEEAGPSTPVLIHGLSSVPIAGERFFAVDDLAHGREIAQERETRERLESQLVRQHVSLDKLYNPKSAREVQDLKLIIKTDVRGSLEAIKVELAKLDHEEVKIRILHDAVGAVNESDVLLADTSDAIIIAFNVVADSRADLLAKERGVEIRRYSIIYQVSDDIRKAMEGMLIPDKKEVQLGRAVIQDLFNISRFGTIAGCRVIQGTIERNAQLRVIRDGTIVGTYPIESLKRHKDDAKEVREGMECGIKISGYDDVKKGDVLEAFKIEEVKRTL
ncbi:translation initiation factor IF-2 [bacterium]|nr:translation initiation factor IF-2 [bacterium]